MRITLLTICACAALLRCQATCAMQPPPDVRSSHWAAPAVAKTIKAKVLRLQSDGRFHGDAKVTRTEAVLALAAMGRILVEGSWNSSGRSRPVPDSVSAVWAKTDWKDEPVRRYAFAAILTRFADYLANSARRPAAGAKVGQSEALSPVTLSVSPDSPAYSALKYLAENRMVKPGSPLLKPDNSALAGRELSSALAELATGVTDRLTEVGKDADGNTPDVKPNKRPPR